MECVLSFSNEVRDQVTYNICGSNAGSPILYRTHCVYSTNYDIPITWLMNLRPACAWWPPSGCFRVVKEVSRGLTRELWQNGGLISRSARRLIVNEQSSAIKATGISHIRGGFVIFSWYATWREAEFCLHAVHEWRWWVNQPSKSWTLHPQFD